jgi:hypothetical protein
LQGSKQAWRETWIIGGGPSARAFDLGSLRGQNILAVNDSIDLLLNSLHNTCHGDFAPPLFSLDNRWIQRRREFLAAYPGDKYLAVPLDTWPECGGIPGATYLRWSHADGLSEDLEVVCTGCNSGYAAINLAYLKGAQLIHLFGYDMDPKDNDAYEYWASLFRNMLPQLNARGIQVINHNPRSFVTAFPMAA